MGRPPEEAPLTGAEIGLLRDVIDCAENLNADERDEALGNFDALAAQLAAQGRVIEAAREARALVDEQAEDEALWCIAGSVVEAYFQQELRRLHAAVEAIPLETR